MKKVLIAGAGPAGLTAAYELLRNFTSEYEVTIIEKCARVGGLAKTISNKNFRMDIGGHRYFSKNDRIVKWWNHALQNDDLLTVRRSSRIFYQGKFISYPLAIDRKTISTIGLVDGANIIASYLFSRIFPSNEVSLEDFYINRFGKELYHMFFRDYTEKVWGRSPNAIPPDWGYQRVKGLSILKVLFNALSNESAQCKEASLTDYFYYPKYGSGYMWETVANDIVNMGGRIIYDDTIEEIETCEDRIERVKSSYGRCFYPDYFISSIPLDELIAAMRDAPKRTIKISQALEYRSFIIVGLCIQTDCFDDTSFKKPDGTIISDQWIYIQDSSVRMGRIQIIDNWSPDLHTNDKDKLCIGVEYFCQKDDDLWKKSDPELVQLSMVELTKIHLLKPGQGPADTCVQRVEKAYPCYWGGYSEISSLRHYLDGFSNFICVGRNGQHRYNNLDHAMETAFSAVDYITGHGTKMSVWDVNSYLEYHENK